MSSFSPPTYFFTGIGFNNNFYDQQSSGGISSSYADSHYLQSTGTATSSAILTTFSGNVLLNASLITSSMSVLLTNNYNISLIGGITYLLPTVVSSYTLTLPLTIYGEITINNSCGANQILSHSGAIIGQYGSNATTLILYNNSSIKLVGIATNWSVIEPFSRFTTIFKSGNYNITSGIASVL